MFKRAQDSDYTVNRNVPTRAHQGPILFRLTAHGEIYYRCIEHYGSMQWNALPPPVRLLPSLKMFKLERKTWLAGMVPVVLR